MVSRGRVNHGGISKPRSGGVIPLDQDGDGDMAGVGPSQYTRAKGYTEGSNGGIRKRQGGRGVIRLGYDGDVEMANTTRPSQHSTRTKGHANSRIRKQWQRGGGGMIRLDHDGDVEMADITGPSQYATRTKGYIDSGIRKQRGGAGGVIRVDHDGDVIMADIRPTGFISKKYSQTTNLSSFSSLGTDQDLTAIGPFNKDQMTAFLSKRYHQQIKLLDLSSLGADPDFVAMGLSKNTTTESSFFSALMKVWSMNFDSLEKSRAAVDSVTLANNCLVDISPVTILSQAFPKLKHLDLSNNFFKDAQALAGWKQNFRQLEYLDLSGTPFSWDLSFKDTMLKWYPKLQTLNKIQVRTADELAAQFINRASKHTRTKGYARIRESKAGTDTKKQITTFLSKQYY
jgi:Leucine Rich repeats (2 copies)